ncbi:putative transposition, RNA-mediated [Lyophyllum shimeji]|uniref:Transposition, RNA-mediated n=1 Tax=Lyophyllum shimeji TaxID=47721 RepID=A0A9P3Q1J6_LYOSH|nr:putative transposition, RNA-mediated [Lyophyllum shimeji]
MRTIGPLLQIHRNFEGRHKNVIHDYDFAPGKLVMVLNKENEPDVGRKYRPRYFGPMVVAKRLRSGAYCLAEGWLTFESEEGVRGSQHGWPWDDRFCGDDVAERRRLRKVACTTHVPIRLDRPACSVIFFHSVRTRVVSFRPVVWSPRGLEFPLSSVLAPFSLRIAQRPDGSRDAARSIARISAGDY